MENEPMQATNSGLRRNEEMYVARERIHNLLNTIMQSGCPADWKATELWLARRVHGVLEVEYDIGEPEEATR